jgi:hypothetical protein
VTLEEIAARLAPDGLALRGALHVEPGELSLPPIGGARTLVLVGYIGAAGWAAFENSPERRDGASDPLDRWSRRVVGALAEACGGAALYPFDGRPYHPFQRWARRADNVNVSPLGMLIHPRFGLWHSYRGALALAQRLDLPPLAAARSPCETCEARPCLSACPVGAFAPGSYDVEACVDHLSQSEGAECMNGGCLARRSCPVGVEFAHEPVQARFHMEAFRAARTP